MAFDVVYGNNAYAVSTQSLVEAISSSLDEGTLYLGYPILATADEKIEIDALLVSEVHGITAFQVPPLDPTSEIDWESLEAAQDRLFNALESHLSSHEGLRTGRRFALDITTVTVLPTSRIDLPTDTGEATFLKLDEVPGALAEKPGIEPHFYRALQAALQRVSTIRPSKKRVGATDPDSRGATMKIIEQGIANLDFFQKKAAIETPQGPQRIRGLAGSGKTIVLALKASLLHAAEPDSEIVVTFNSRSLYQQFEDLVTRFSFAHTSDRFDPERLHIMHAWGAGSRPGTYWKMARSLGVDPYTFSEAREKFGYNNAFGGACDELLKAALELVPSGIEPIFDIVLVDEAQDLPPSFFRLLYLLTKEPKRIVWAYDEMQKLSEDAMPSVSELFGTTVTGDPLVSLTNREGEPTRDVVLPTCYRNSPWALATAHSLGFGIYHQDGLVQHFDEPSLWNEIGYTTVRGSLSLGAQVTLERSQASTPSYFYERLTADDAVLLKDAFTDEGSQDRWVAKQIRSDIEEQQLEPDDIMVVLPSAYTAKSRFARFAQILRSEGVTCHLVGASSTTDDFFRKESVAVAHIFRAKGNEAPMVYVLDAQFSGGALNEFSARNTLFTAITRSKAWVRICGWGTQMKPISQEIKATQKNDYQLDFVVPTRAKLAELRRITQSSGSSTLGSMSLDDILSGLESGEISLDQIDPNTKKSLQRLNQLNLQNNDD